MKNQRFLSEQALTLAISSRSRFGSYPERRFLDILLQRAKNDPPFQLELCFTVRLFEKCFPRRRIVLLSEVGDSVFFGGR